MLWEEAGVTISGFYYCPHHPQGSVAKYAVTCECRKPNPGMLLRAADELQINLSDAWMVGDILNDVEAGNRAGCRTILIDNGNETEWKTGLYREPDFKAADLRESAEIILSYLKEQNQKEASQDRPGS
jgi:D-glycero-D-manno-heptose 1,7-bisphosphate phosphatase